VTFTLDLCRLRPSTVALDVVGTSLEGGRSISGLTQQIDLSGGGFVTCAYGGIPLYDTATARAWNELAGLIRGSVRYIYVPLITDQVTPVNAKGEYPGIHKDNTPHSDGRYFKDGVGYHQGLQSIKTNDDRPLNGQVINLEVPGGVPIYAGIWFSLFTSKKLHHAHRIIEILTRYGDNDVTARIEPPFRDAIPKGSVVDVYRPMCTMHLKPGTSLEWAVEMPAFMSWQDVAFEEHFP
jgi:hypothetical protein